MSPRKKTKIEEDKIEEKKEANIEKKIEELKVEIKTLVKNRSVMENQKMGKKIDSLLQDHEFLISLKGNGVPSVNERLRNIDKNISWIWKIIVFIIIIDIFGGSIYSISKEKIKELCGIKKNTETKQIEEQPKETIINED